MVTVREIAAKTGCSISTVSRVLRKDPTFYVSPQTRDKIEACARELHYKYREREPSNVLPKPGHTHRVGILPVDLETERGELQDPYYLHIRNGIESALGRARLSGTILNINHPEDYEKFSLVDERRAHAFHFSQELARLFLVLHK